KEEPTVGEAETPVDDAPDPDQAAVAPREAR
ncbi:MAG: hypothetical protein QOJ50_661, partial [Cryptosporangiaceae bacterium]|nr:hypothetical protein [Cryptosporangiaceae bacterium]